jgi:hypothetical protein
MPAGGIGNGVCQYKRPAGLVIRLMRAEVRD